MSQDSECSLTQRLNNLQMLNEANIDFVVFKSYDYLHNTFNEKDIDILINPKHKNKLFHIVLKRGINLTYENILEKKLKLENNIDIYTYVGKKGITLFRHIDIIIDDYLSVKYTQENRVLQVPVMNPMNDFFIRCAILPFDISCRTFYQKINELKRLSAYNVSKYGVKEFLNRLQILILSSEYRLAIASIVRLVLEYTLPSITIKDIAKIIAYLSEVFNSLHSTKPLKCLLRFNRLNPYIILLIFLVLVFLEDLIIKEKRIFRSLKISFTVLRHFLGIMLNDSLSALKSFFKKVL